MILIITHKTDFTVDFVIDKLNKRNISYRRFNCEDVLEYDCSIRFGNTFDYSILGNNNYDSVWFRRTKLPDTINLQKEEQVYVLSEIDSLFKNIFSSINTSKWLSHPRFVYEAENKILQLKVAQKIGFKIPKTIITNSKNELKHFISECNNDVIIKPISQAKIQYNEGAKFIFTNKLEEQVLANIDSYDLTPCIYQQNIKKDYELRVTVVNGAVFSAVVFSQKDKETINDWRKKNLKFYPIEIPKKLQEMCNSLLDQLNLKFGAIDLIKTPEDEYIFLEINPNGQWAWIEAQTGLKISEAIMEYLL